MRIADLGIFLSAFLVSLVEASEAALITVAAAQESSLRSALKGAFLGGLLTLALGFGIGTPLYRFVPLNLLRAVVGAYLFAFGLKWFARTARALSGRGSSPAGPGEVSERISEAEGLSVAFRGVLIEGLEIALVVLTLGSGSRDFAAPLLGAGAACVLVVGAALSLRSLLKMLPETFLKGFVSLMLLSLGTFFCAEAGGSQPPGKEAFLPVFFLVFLTGLIAASALRRQLERQEVGR